MNPNAAFSASSNGDPLREERPFSRWTALWATGLVLVWVLSAGGSSVWLCLALGVGTALMIWLLRSRALERRFGLQALFVLAYVVLSGASCYYADSGSLALDDYLRLLPAFFVYLAILLFSGRGKFAGRNGAAAVSAATAFISFLSIDAAGTHWFSGAFQWLTGYFTGDYSLFTGLETGTRITSILEDPNVFAGVVGLGVLLSLSLVLSAAGNGERVFHLCCLELNALGFVLVFSVGAAGFIVVAYVALLLFQGKGSRLSATILMAETLLVTMLGVVAVYLAVFDGSKSFSLVPLLSCVGCCVSIWALDKWVSPSVLVSLSAHPRMMAGVLAGVALALTAYTVAAVNITGAASLVSGEALERAADLSGGAYICNVDATDGAQVQVVTKNKNDLIMHTETVLYEGAANKVFFTVPEDSEIVWFRFSAPEGGKLSAVYYSGGSEGSLKLGYKLLPGFIANRLQGLWANQNAVQRVQFWRDGLKLWQRHPVFGNGMAAMETGLFSVASFYYQSKYAHNHYVQCLMDIGAVGFICFLGILASSAWLFWRGRRKEASSPLLPALGAALVFMILQATMQVDFSTHSFLPFAFAVFALLNVTSVETPAPKASLNYVVVERRKRKRMPEPAPTEPEEKPKSKEESLRGKRLRISLCWSYAGFALLCSVLLAFNLGTLHNVSYGNGSGFQRLDSAIKTDPLDRVRYLQTYLYYGMDSDSTTVQQRMRTLAEMLSECRMNSDPNYAVEYYFSRQEVKKAVDTLLTHLAYNRARPTVWQYAYDLLAAKDDGSDAFRTQALRVVEAMDEWNAQTMEQVELTEANQAYLTTLR